ncbi:MAG: phytoene/squalene synthase family protein [Phycisphaerales bacterium]
MRPAGSGISVEVEAGTGVMAPARAGEELRASFDHCREVTRRSARNFYYGLCLTPEPRRSAVYSIYAWMRHADDVVDDPAPLEVRRRRLDELRDATEAVLRGESPGGSEGFWPAFESTLREYPIKHEWIRDMLAGMGEDLEHAGYATQAELDQYCDRVASTVGLVCVSIWGLRAGASTEAARSMSIARGRAFQLTNILRDIGHDYDESPGRVYVPRALLEEHGLTAAELRGWKKPGACEALVGSLVELARARYRESEPLERLIDPACAPAMWGMTRIYSGLLEAIARAPARVVGPGRVRLSPLVKGFIAVRAFARARTAGRASAGAPPGREGSLSRR